MARRVPRPDEIRLLQSWSEQVAWRVAAAVIASAERQPSEDRMTLIVTARDQIEEMERVVVLLSRSDGATWDQIGAALGTSKQAAYDKFNRGQFAIDRLLAELRATDRLSALDRELPRVMERTIDALARVGLVARTDPSGAAKAAPASPSGRSLNV